jgi:hypothetical protein
MASFSDELSCISFPKVERSDLSDTEWDNGIMFVWEDDLIDVGCWSIVGQISGYSSGTLFSTIEETGAPSGWQVVALASSCLGETESTIHHEVMHALGWPHEHVRPDRDEYLLVNMDVASSPSQYSKLTNEEWEDYSYPFDLKSVLLYCSFCGTLDWSTPVMTLKDGSIFHNALSLNNGRDGSESCLLWRKK